MKRIVVERLESGWWRTFPGDVRRRSLEGLRQTLGPDAKLVFKTDGWRAPDLWKAREAGRLAKAAAELQREADRAQREAVLFLKGVVGLRDAAEMVGLSPEQVRRIQAKRKGTGPRTYREWMESGRLPPMKIPAPIPDEGMFTKDGGAPPSDDDLRDEAHRQSLRYGAASPHFETIGARDEKGRVRSQWKPK